MAGQQGVEIADKDGVTWYEFRDLNHRLYRMRIVGQSCRFDRARNIEPPTSPELSVSKALFKRIVPLLAREENGREVRLGSHGRFFRRGSSVTFHLPCGERHTFDLEDLLILADQID